VHCMYIQHLNTDWGYFSIQRKKPFCQLCSFCFNEHICAEDAALRAEQLKVAIPWWLR
jgi:hypothetical protein